MSVFMCVWAVINDFRFFHSIIANAFKKRKESILSWVGMNELMKLALLECVCSSSTQKTNCFMNERHLWVFCSLLWWEETNKHSLAFLSRIIIFSFLNEMYLHLFNLLSRKLMFLCAEFLLPWYKEIKWMKFYNCETQRLNVVQGVAKMFLSFKVLLQHNSMSHVCTWPSTLLSRRRIPTLLVIKLTYLYVNMCLSMEEIAFMEFCKYFHNVYILYFLPFTNEEFQC